MHDYTKKLLRITKEISEIVDKQLFIRIDQHNGWENILRTQNQMPNLPRNQQGNWIGIVFKIMMIMRMINKTHTLIAYDFANPKLGTIYSLVGIEKICDVNRKLRS